MIRRTDDFNSFSSDALNKISKVVNKKEEKQMYGTYHSLNEARIVESELKVKGIESETYKVGNDFRIYTLNNVSIPLQDAEDSGQFKKLAWGRYSYQKEAAVGMFDFNFNDGSIWKVSQDENGNSVLIKEVDDENEDEVVRSNQLVTNMKTASNSDISLINDSNFKNVTSMFYGNQNDDFIELILSTQNKYQVFEKLSNKFNEVVNTKLSNCQINDEKESDELKKMIISSINEDIKKIDDMDVFLKSYIEDKISKAGQQRKYFS